MTAHQLREYVAGHMEPMRVAKLKQFRKTTSPVAGWKITSSAGKRGHLETITRLLIPTGSTVFVGDMDGYANQGYLYRQFRANQAVVLSNYAVPRHVWREELNEIKKNGSPFVVPNYQNPDYRVQCTLSIHDPTFEYRAARMDDVITASERWREEAFEDALHAIHTNPELSKTYAFMYNGCIYESGPSVMSLHWTKAGAYRAMNRYLFGEWEKHNHGWGRKRYSGRGTKALDRRFEWWGIKEFPIHP